MWIRIDTDIGHHRKTLMLRTALACSTAATVGHLVMLFARLGECESDGRIDDLADVVLEDWAGWTGTPGIFAHSFREQFVTDGIIDGWLERQGVLLERRERDRARKSGRRARKSDGIPADVHRTSRGSPADVQRTSGGSPDDSLGNPGVTSTSTSTSTGDEDDAKASSVGSALGDVDVVLAHYVSRHPKRRPGKKERTLVSSRLKQGYSVVDLCLAIDGNADDEWHREHAKHELSYVLRDASKVDTFLELAQRARQTPEPLRKPRTTAERTYVTAMRVLNAGAAVEPAFNHAREKIS